MIRILIFIILILIPRLVCANQYAKDADILHNQMNNNIEQKNIVNQAKIMIENQSKIDMSESEMRAKSLPDVMKNNRHNLYLQKMISGISQGEFDKSYKESQKQQLNQLMVFVSSSMPKKSLEDYAMQLKEVGGTMVLRGLINNSFAQTTSYIHSLNKDGAVAIIDPLSYKNFDIRHVPQIVVIADDHGCKWGRCQTTPFHDKISGNITIKHALTEISKHGEFTKKEADRFLSKL